MKRLDNPWYDPRNNSTNYEESPYFIVEDTPNEVEGDYEFYQREEDCIVWNTRTMQVVTQCVTAAGARRLLKLPTNLGNPDILDLMKDHNLL